MKYFSVIIILLFMGCSTFQPSKYTNYNTPNGNVVEATGAAAEAAASANTSHYGTNNVNRPRYYRSRNTNPINTIGNSAVNSAVSATSMQLNREIQNIIRGAFGN
jgi:hypothetical protein